MRETGALAAVAAGLAAVGGVLVVAPTFLVGGVALAAMGDSTANPAGGALATEMVPPEYVAFIQEAATRCEAVSGPLLAAQIQAESGWNPTARSPVGAMGISQFMPGTWQTWGKDYDGDGHADPLSPADAIGSQADYMCHLHGWVTEQLAAGSISGDPIDLTLASYNAGTGNVQKYAGVPPFTETQGYVARIRSAMLGFTHSPLVAGNGGGIVEVAKTQLGVPYVWGGGNLNGPTNGGFDCSGFVTFTIYQSTGVALPHLADAVARSSLGATVPRDPAAMQPGDVIGFSNSGGATFQHVGIYIGDGQMIHTPMPGRSVEIASVNSPYWANQVWSVRRFG